MMKGTPAPRSFPGHLCGAPPRPSCFSSCLSRRGTSPVQDSKGTMVWVDILVYPECWPLSYIAQKRHVILELACRWYLSRSWVLILELYRSRETYSWTDLSIFWGLTLELYRSKGDISFMNSLVDLNSVYPEFWPLSYIAQERHILELACGWHLSISWGLTLELYRSKGDVSFMNSFVDLN